MDTRELAHRTATGIDVTLVWRAADDRLAVVVFDSQSGDCLEVAVEEGDDALDVFHHPFAYAAFRSATLDPLRL
jgi:hypothetical protein